MITLCLNQEEYEYDCYAMVTSFYPGVETRQIVDAADAQERAEEKEAHGEAADWIRVTADAAARTALVCFTAGESLPRTKSYSISAEELTFYLSAEELPRERAFRRAFKLFFYDVMADYTGRGLPWGALSGVRPTKLILSVTVRERSVMERAEAARRETSDGGAVNSTGRPAEAALRRRVLDRMYAEYRVTEEKAALGYEIAQREATLLEPFRTDAAGAPRAGWSLYIGIPFCPTTCLYCSFASYPIAAWQPRVAEYLGCLERELAAAAEIQAGQRPDTIYVGGGTPSALSAEELERLLAAVTETFGAGSGMAEFTVEAGRPDSITEEKLRALRRYGVSRISVNPQTFQEETLRRIGRQHTVEEVYRAYAQAREAGFSNINMDLILGLPGETLPEIEDTMAEVRRLRPDSITVHSLALKRASRMREWVRTHGQLGGLDYERAMACAHETAAALELFPYYLYRQKNIAGALENTGFAREGAYGLYNVIMMEEVQSIYAIGAGTVSKRVDADGAIRRCDTHKDLALYMVQIEEMIERKRRLFAEEQ